MLQLFLFDNAWGMFVEKCQPATGGLLGACNPVLCSVKHQPLFLGR